MEQFTLPQLLFIGALAVGVVLLISFFLIRGAVKSGTEDIVQELRKQNKHKEPVS